MNLYAEFTSRVQALVADLLPAAGRAGTLARILAEPPRDPAHGDLATNAALVAARPAAMPPPELARRLAARLAADPDVAAAEVAGPGFVNLRLRDGLWRRLLGERLRHGAMAGLADLGRGRKANVEYVSANPTGPLHIGHARGAVYGDALASLLAAVGFRVTREYYVNDAGSQIDKLARSAYLRYLQALGEEVPACLFQGLYPGDYLAATGEALAREHGDALKRAAGAAGSPEDPLPPVLAPVRRFAVEAMTALIRDDLALLGIEPDVFSSEQAMVASGGIEACLAKLERKGLVYTGVLEPPKGRKPEDWEPLPQTLFRSTAFGDDLDRPLKKSDGSWTYFAPDIAYHNGKLERGFEVVIDVFGSDHAGYVGRLKAAVAALSDGKARFDILLTQLVNLCEDGVPVRMSKRAGHFATLREVVDAVGKDVVRFLMLTRRPDAPLDFDLVRVREQSRDNPVFYVHYAHARIRSVMRHAEEAGVDTADLAAAPLDALAHEAEIALVKVLARWPRTVEGAAMAREPHRIAAYLHELAGAFHALWNKGRDHPSLRFLGGNNAGATRARLALLQGVQQTIAAGLGLFGVEPREEMR